MSHLYRDQAKVVRVIESCVTADQAIMAWNMATNFLRYMTIQTMKRDL